MNINSNAVKPLELNGKLAHNKLVIDDIIKYCQVKEAAGQLFLRWTTNPFEDVNTGFTAPHQYGGDLCEDVDPFADSIEQAQKIMHTTTTEQYYYTIRALNYQEDTRFEKESLVYKSHNFEGPVAHTCPPVYDTRANKVIINPEFGLSCYRVGYAPSYEQISSIMRSVSNGMPNQDVFWHLFSASHYHDKETNSHRPGVILSDKIVCILNAKHLGSVQECTDNGYW